MKINDSKKIQKRRTENDMRQALAAFEQGKPQRSIPPQIDDTDIIMRDCIEEVLELRQQREDVRTFVNDMYTRMNTR